MTAKEYMQRLLVCAQKSKSDTLEFLEENLQVSKGDEKAKEMYNFLFPNNEMATNALIIYANKENIVLIDLINATFLANRDLSIGILYFMRFNEELPSVMEIKEKFQDVQMF